MKIRKESDAIFQNVMYMFNSVETKPIINVDLGVKVVVLIKFISGLFSMTLDNTTHNSL